MVPLAMKEVNRAHVSPASLERDAISRSTVVVTVCRVRTVPRARAAIRRRAPAAATTRFVIVRRVTPTVGVTPHTPPSARISNRHAPTGSVTMVVRAPNLRVVTAVRADPASTARTAAHTPIRARTSRARIMAAVRSPRPRTVSLSKLRSGRMYVIANIRIMVATVNRVRICTRPVLTVRVSMEEHAASERTTLTTPQPMAVVVFTI